MNNTEIIVIVRRHEPDGSYSEWSTKPGLFAFSAKMKREVKKILRVIE
jgi:hypothetical protein